MFGRESRRQCVAQVLAPRDPALYCFPPSPRPERSYPPSFTENASGLLLPGPLQQATDSRIRSSPQMAPQTPLVCHGPWLSSPPVLLFLCLQLRTGVTLYPIPQASNLGINFDVTPPSRQPSDFLSPEYFSVPSLGPFPTTTGAVQSLSLPHSAFLIGSLFPSVSLM